MEVTESTKEQTSLIVRRKYQEQVTRNSSHWVIRSTLTYMENDKLDKITSRKNQSLFII